jgi:hypothetical protein
MLRTAFAGVLGAILAVAAAFLVVAVASALGGVPVMFAPEREVYGWEGAQYGIMLFVVLGAVKVWPFPALALAGAATGVFISRILTRHGTPV